MCRRDCCKPRSQAPGITAAALAVVGAGIIAHKTGHTLAKVAHEIIEVARIAALTTVALVAAVVVVWVVTRLLRGWLGHRQAQQHQARLATVRFAPPHGVGTCIACGGLGEVLRATGDGEFEPRPCPECHPVRLAG